MDYAEGLTTLALFHAYAAAAILVVAAWARR